MNPYDLQELRCSIEQTLLSMQTANKSCLQNAKTRQTSACTPYTPQQIQTLNQHLNDMRRSMCISNRKTPLYPSWSFEGGTAQPDIYRSRLYISLNDRPNDLLRFKLKSAGFHWNSKFKAWGAPLNRTTYAKCALIPEILSDTVPETLLNEQMRAALPYFPPT